VYVYICLHVHLNTCITECADTKTYIKNVYINTYFHMYQHDHINQITGVEERIWVKRQDFVGAKEGFGDADDDVLFQRSDRRLVHHYQRHVDCTQTVVYV